MNISEYEQGKDRGQWPFRALGKILLEYGHYLVFITTQYLSYELKTYPKAGVSMCIREVGTHLPNYKASHPTANSVVTVVRT
jgi:hypothetical protein